MTKLLQTVFDVVRKLPEKQQDELAAKFLEELAMLDQTRADEARLIALGFVPGVTYEVWSPFDAPEAAAKLTEMLNNKKQTPNQDE
jgi:hypothetical protein